MSWNGTKGNWIWGESWHEPEDDRYDGGDFPKHTDHGLFSDTGRIIVPIRVDHGEPIWDVGGMDDLLPVAADRRAIANVPEAYGDNGIVRRLAALFNEKPNEDTISAFYELADEAGHVIAEVDQE